MTSIPDAQGMLALDRTLARIIADHPSETLIGLGHGQGEGFATYLKAAEDAGYMMHHSTTEDELAGNIENVEGVTIALVVQDFLPKPLRRVLAAACEKFDPLYLIQISTSFGIDPESRHRSIITSFCSDEYAESPECKRVSDATYNAFDTANAEALGIDERSFIDLGDLLTAITRRSKDRTE